MTAPASATSALRRGLAMSPELRTGLAGTLALAVAFTAGRVAVPVAIQQGIDYGLRAPGGPDFGRILLTALVTLSMMGVALVSAFWMNVRLFTVAETALASLRTRTFRHIHDLSMLHQQAEKRGSLVSRVTNDVDTISTFLQSSGIVLVINIGQLVITTAVMLTYSWPLTLVVFAAFVPLVLAVRALQRRLTAVYGAVRENVGAMLATIAESVVGAAVVRAYGVRQRSQSRLDQAIESNRVAQVRAMRTSAISFTFGELAAGLATAGVVAVGVLLGVDGHLTVGQLTAFLLLVTLFVQPVQIATEVLNDTQSAIAGWRRVLDIADVVPDVADPASGVASVACTSPIRRDRRYCPLWTSLSRPGPG